MNGSIKRMKRRKFQLGFTIISLIIGVFSISVGMSIVSSSREYSLEQSGGYPDKSRDISINFTNSSIKAGDIEDILGSAIQKEKIEIRNPSIEIKTDLKSTFGNIQPVIYKAAPKWQVNIINGRHLTNEEVNSTKPVAVIGKNIADKLFPFGITKKSYIYINNKKFMVVGIMGRKYRDINYNNYVYIPLKTFPQINSEAINTLDLFLTTNENNVSEVATYVKNQFLKVDSKADIKIENIDIGREYIYVSIGLTVLVSAGIFVITLINTVIFTVFSIRQREKEFAIKKALGAKNRTIIMSIVKEYILISSFAAIIALALQNISEPFINKFMMGAEVKTSITNWLLGFMFSILFSIIAAIIPQRRIVKIQPSQILKYE